MTYCVFHFSFSDPENFISDVLCSQLGEVEFESFVTTDGGVDAFIQQKKIEEEKIKNIIADFPFDVTISYTTEILEQKNWNEEWEKNFFQPIIIDNLCVIHSSFHSGFPKMKYDVIIDPKMAFGTGHHETTSLIVAEILQEDFTNKTVLDMGCGTSVLAILASMRGAKSLTAIDIDEWCVDNSIENIALNNISNVEVLQGDAQLLYGKAFDIIFANINRNILLSDLRIYSSSLNADGLLFMSGFYTEDIPVIQEEAEKWSLKLLRVNSKNNWAMLCMQKD